MEKSATRLSDVQEREWTASIGTAVVGLAVVLAAAFVIWFLKYLIPPELLLTSRIIAAVGLTIGGALIVAAVYRGAQVRKVACVTFTCPYCGFENAFPVSPTDDFDCEGCDRTVHFEEGKPLPVRDAVCPACGTAHRVAVNVAAYLCDNCNRPLNIKPDPRYKTAVVAAKEPVSPDDLMRNYDVLVTAIGRAKENELAFKIQSLLVVNLPDARKMMATANPRTPLVIGYGLPHRKAELMRRQLQELGATVVVRPSDIPVSTGPRRS